MKFNFEEWKNKKVVMHCKTEEEAKDFCRVMHEAGKRWCSGREYISTVRWSDYKENTCYFFNEGAYDNLSDITQEYKILEWSDYMNKSFTKSDLKNGDVIVFRNGKVNIVCVDTGTCITPVENFNYLERFNEELTHCFFESYDIIDVYRPQKPYQCSFSEHLYKDGKHVYHREEPSIEITIDEIAKLKGVSADRIKIVK